MNTFWATTKRARYALSATSAAILAITTVPFLGHATPRAQAASCAVAYEVNQWSGGFTANVTITNGGAALSGWTLTWNFAGDQAISSAWNASVTQSGKAVSATNMSYNGSIPTGGTQSFGFQATFSGTNAAPASFALNGVTCGGTGATATPAPATSTPAPATPTRTPTGATATPTRTPAPTATTAPTTGWPTANGSQPVSSSISVKSGQVYDGGMKRFYGTGDLGSGGQNEGQDPIFDLAAGATLKNVILGAPAADGVHCAGSCTLENVWWEDVGEDAATFRGSSSSNTYLVNGGGARKASDKVFQHNGAGTLTIQNFQVDNFGKLYRSCGNCSTQYKRNVVLKNITATYPGTALVGINTNYGDTARFSGITIKNDSSKKLVICQKYIGNDDGDEPTTNGSGADGTYCIYSSSDITYK
ncbi:pectate lyase [Chloroflexia bacterium SDU3-3]|nr:pectate lyase [Chloroflexia bacterium SDU3-3]